MPPSNNEAASNSSDTQDFSHTPPPQEDLGITDQAAHEQFRLLLENAQDHVIFTTDLNGVAMTWNPGVERILGYGRTEWLGQPADIIFVPEDRAKNVPEEERRRAREQDWSDDIRWHQKKDGSRFWAEGSLVALHDKQGDLRGYGKIMRDATKRKVSEEQERTRLTQVFMRSPAFIAILRGSKHIFDLVNPPFYQLVGHRDLQGKPAVEALPEVTNQGFIELMDQVYNTGEPFSGSDIRVMLQTAPTGPMEERFVDFSYQPLYEEDGAVTGILLHGIDLTERKRLEQQRERLFEEQQRLLDETRQRAEREALVNAIGTAIMNSPLDAEGILRAAVAALGKGIGADRCYYVRYDQNEDTAHVGAEWYRDDALEPLGTGAFQMSAYSVDRDARYKAGNTHVVEDVMTFSPEDAAPLLALGLRALVRVPVQIGNQMTAIAVAMAGEPRSWSESDVRVVETVASQLQSALNAARLLEQEHQRAEREALINEIGAALRLSSDPEDMQSFLVERIGQALQTDHCFITIVDAVQDTFVIGQDYCSDPALPSLAGRYRLSDFLESLNTLYADRKPLIVPDTHVLADFVEGDMPFIEPQTVSAMAEMGLRSVVNVPLYEGDRLVGALGVGMARMPRAWEADEVALVETLATQARAAVDAARLQQRERNIARQLQEALQPVLPSSVPGIFLDGYYKAALEEAEVGGDFLAAYVMPDNRSVLCVGDLSGKGLAAARMVGVVTNSLRYALHRSLRSGGESGTLSRAIAELNRILVEGDLLTGFATLFVGVYDAPRGLLRYVNCGQEPALIWRAATGAVEELAPTGPVLGGFDAGAFTEASVTLQNSDIIALFTDGLTEAGPSRQQMLEVKGVSALLQNAAEEATGNSSAGEIPKAVLARLVAGVNAYAGGGVRDDVALLVGVVTDSGGASSAAG